MTHGQLVTPDDPHVGDGLAVLIQRLDSGDDVVQVLLGQAFVSVFIAPGRLNRFRPVWVRRLRPPIGREPI